MGEAPMSIEALRVAIASGTIDTVLLALTDMQGRLQGKRLHAPFFLDEVLAHGSEACNYLLAVDVEMNTISGYAISGWERGYGDFALLPDMSTLRRIPWQPGTALVLADLAWLDGAPVAESPRQILRRQLDLLEQEHGLVAYVGTELEFVAHRESYEDAQRRDYRNLTPVNGYNVDYSMLGTARVEPLLRRIRLEMAGAGLRPESAKGECNLGQHEIAFRYDEALTTADHHAVYKNGVKEIAAQEGCSITFMAKPNAREGNSCHVHFSLRTRRGEPVMSGPGGALSQLGERVLAGMLTATRELALFLAPNINSYKRFQSGSFAPTALRWGRDNRTCALRLVGHGSSLRVEHRVPGADVNPYLAIAALVAAARHGLSAGLALEDEHRGDAYADPAAPRVPASLREALSTWRNSTMVREAFGPAVVAHYARAAEVEIEAFDAAVTDWELRRGYERL